LSIDEPPGKGKGRNGSYPLGVNLDKTECEHIGPAFGRIAANAPLCPGTLSFAARS